MILSAIVAIYIYFLRLSPSASCGAPIGLSPPPASSSAHFSGPFSCRAPPRCLCAAAALRPLPLTAPLQASSEPVRPAEQPRTPHQTPLHGNHRFKAPLTGYISLLMCYNPT